MTHITLVGKGGGGHDWNISIGGEAGGYSIRLGEAFRLDIDDYWMDKLDKAVDWYREYHAKGKTGPSRAALESIYQEIGKALGK